MKRLCLILTIIPGVLMGQVYFKSEKFIVGGDSVLRNASTLKIADMDNDGDHDIIAGGTGERAVFFYSNNGEGEFEKITINTEGRNAYYIDIADRENDGDLDILVASTNTGSVSWLINNNEEGFESQTIYTASNTRKALAEDLDQDGDLDVIISYSTDNRMDWFENDGLQNYTRHIIEEEEIWSFDFEIGDIDGDGDLDIAATSNENASYYLNDGNQHFSESILQSGSGFWAIRIADIDGDLDNDIITCFDQYITINRNNGSEVFTVDTIDMALDYARDLIISDMDKDGDLDVLQGGNGQTEINWLENIGDGSFNKHYVAEMRLDVSAVASEDLDSDGYADIAFCAYSAYDVGWCHNSGDDYSYQTNYFTNSIFRPYQIAVEDFNQDGYNDVLGIGLYDLRLYTNSPAQEFIGEKLTEAEYVGRTMLTVDLDEDDDIDIITPIASDYRLVWFENNNTGGFEQHTICDAVDDSYSINFIGNMDLDNDEDQDILFSLTSDYSISWCENDGAYNFTSHILTDTISYFREILLCDVNIDGNEDLLISSNYNLYWFRNDGMGNFTPETIADSLPSYTSLVCDDIDQDNDMDIIFAADESNRICWMENNGENIFTGHSLPDNYIYVNDIVVSDINSDGNNDLIISYNNMAAAINDGDQNFSRVYIADNNQTISIIAKDLNNDDDIDIICNNHYENSITWFENCEPSFTSYDTTICNGDVFFINGVNQTVSGTYYDYYTASNGCDSIIEATLIVEACGSGLAPDNENAFQIYPNPVKDVLTVEGSKIELYEVYDLLGNKVAQGTINRINFSEMDESLYILKLTLENGDNVLVRIYHY